AAEWLGLGHGEGTGGDGKVEIALGFSLVWAGRGSRTVTATSNLPVVEGEPTLFEIWVCADGYWADHTKNLVVGELTDRHRELEEVRRRATGSFPRARGGPPGGVRRRRRVLHPGCEPRRPRPSDPRGDRAHRLP